ncbi:MAG TPA: cyclopropane-fatty-acyl-phospholipid synthase family protein [Acidimicrobiales bacterium]
MSETQIGASPDAIEHHYDVGRDFYALWLDPSLTYSCALWTGITGDESDTDVLAAAQQAKLDYHLDRAGVGEGSRVLDVGCGWGSLLAAASARGAGDLTGLTLSRDQLDAAQSRRLPGADIRLEHWRDHQPERPYDAIVSIGAFEHFANRGLSADERVAVYGEFFARCHGWLPPNAMLSLQTIAYDDEVDDEGPVASFFVSDVFPSSMLPRLSDIVRASDPWFSVSSFRNDGDHYTRTLRGWSVRLQRARAAAEELVGADGYAHYVRYLRVSQAMFRRRTSTLYRIAFRRRPEALAVT